MKKRILAMAAACLTMAAGCTAPEAPASLPAAETTGAAVRTDAARTSPSQAASTAARTTGRETTDSRKTTAASTRTTAETTTATTATATAATTASTASATQEAPPAPTEATEPSRPDKMKTFVLPDCSGREASVLVLGNSFVNTSEIGISLQRLAEENGQNLFVNAVSQGYAEVSTYVPQIDAFALRDGVYDAVFLCGFYSNQLASLQALCDAVQGTKTRIVIFPAQNESLTQGVYAFRHTEGVGYLGWKSLIDALWATGGYEKEHLAYLDQHTHTNPLGGYAGALMLYSYLYRQAPSTEDSRRFMLDYQGGNIPGNSWRDKQEALRTMETYAAEFVLGKRPYF